MIKKTSPPTPPKRPLPTEPIPISDNVELDRSTNRPRFVKGNQLWQTVKIRKGARALITDAGELWQKAIDYFNWCDHNPQYRPEAIKHQGEGSTMDMSLGRPYSVDAFTIYCGVSRSYFRTRKAELGDKEAAKTARPEELELLDMIHLIEDIIRTQRFDGAAVGIFKENLISRVDGYADNINQNNTGEIRQNIVVRDQKTADDLNKLDEMLK